MASHRTTGREIRRRNRSALLSELFFDGPLSRLELAERTGVSPATASNLTAQLMEERIVVEAGRRESEGGRPRVLLRVDPGYAHVIGVDVGETVIRVELFDLTMERLAVALRPVVGRPEPLAVGAAVVSGVEQVLAAAGLGAGEVLGVGVGVPGVVEPGFTPLVHARAIGWDGVPLVAILRAAGLELPVRIESAAMAFGRAEAWFGAARGARTAVVALVGVGVGAATIEGGQSGEICVSVAEWGHTTIAFGGRGCRCGARGCLEAYVGARAVLEQFAQLPGGPTGPAGNEEAQLESALDRAAAGPGPAADLIAGSLDRLGAGVADLINLFGPDRVIIGGWAGVALGRRLLPRISESARRAALAYRFGRTRIEVSTLGPGAVALGAASLPIAALINSSDDSHDDESDLAAVALPRLPVEVA